MGQPVSVVEKPSSTPGILRFEANRNLTGMGHQRYGSYDDVMGTTPGAVLARRLFDTGKANTVHIFGNMITVGIADGQNSDGLRSVVEELYTFYVPGYVPPPLVMPDAPAATSDGAEVGASGAGTVDSRVPADLLAKSQVAKTKWFAAKAAAEG